MSEEKQSIPHNVMVDRFIEIANDFSRSATKESVGAAMMFAAARYNAYEASTKSKNIAADRNDARTWYSNEYQRMWDANMDEFAEGK
jgi:hypothetical protein